MASQLGAAVPYNCSVPSRLGNCKTNTWYGANNNIRNKHPIRNFHLILKSAVYSRPNRCALFKRKSAPILVRICNEGKGTVQRGHRQMVRFKITWLQFPHNTHYGCCRIRRFSQFGLDIKWHRMAKNAHSDWKIAFARSGNPASSTNWVLKT